MFDGKRRVTDAEAEVGTGGHPAPARPADRLSAKHRRNDAARVESGARSMTRALGRRAAAGEIEALAGLRAIQREARATLSTGARAGVEAGHWTWGDVARELGMSRQAANKMFGQGER